MIGLTGLQGAGSSELLQCMFGATPAYGGNMYVNGNCVPHHSIQAAMKNKVAMLPANRKENSVVPDMSILENMYLAEHVLSKKKPCISKNRKRKNIRILKIY
ncbi:MAG: ATP-binding cassette domain-containing protein [Roseburia hominis]